MKKSKKVLLILIVVFFVFLIFLYSPDIKFDHLLEKYENENSNFIDIDLNSNDEKKTISIHYHSINSEIDEKLILIHGIFSSSYSFTSLSEMFNDYNVILIDLPGHGLSSLLPDNITSINIHTEVVKQVIEKLNFKTFFLGGNSMGSGICLNFASMYSEIFEIKGLILINSILVEEFDMARFDFSSSLPLFITNFISKLTPRIFFEIVLNNVYGDVEKPSKNTVTMYEDFIRREGVRDQILELKWRNEEYGTVYENLNKSNIPILIIWGSKDTVTPISNAFFLEEKLDNIELVIYDDVGHEPQVEAQKMIYEDIINFLEINSQS